jgi:hypothetical protein
VAGRRELYTIDTSEPGFIHIHHVDREESGLDMGGHIWFERGSLPWVVDTLRACTTTYGFPESVTRIGQDSLKVFESGAEQAPYINLFNVRPADARHGGIFARSFSKPLAKKLVLELAALR